MSEQTKNGTLDYTYKKEKIITHVQTHTSTNTRHF